MRTTFRTCFPCVLQSRYLAHEPSQESARDSRWIVPLSIFFNRGSAPKRATGFLLEDQESASLFLGGTERNGVIFGNWLSRGRTGSQSLAGSYRGKRRG